MNRRAFLQASAAMGGIFGLQMLAKPASASNSVYESLFRGWDADLGELYPTAANNTGEKLLALPRGFQYNVFGKTGDIMSDGRPTPGSHDGMGAFEVNGQIRLVRNHEVSGTGTAIGDPDKAYDIKARGGTTTLVVDPHTRELVRDFVSLSGTVRNCAGGVTPWGSWLTCEETNVGPNSGYDKQHGYLFEVPADADEEVKAEPLPAQGLFYREAAVVDPDTGIVYHTEDLNPGGIYRYVPENPGELNGPGKFQMLGIKNKPQYDTRTGQQRNELLRVTWIDIPDREPANYEEERLAVYYQGLELGGATFDRPEGMWYSKGTVFFDCTSGGDAGLGQIWALRVKPPLAGTLRLIYESTDERKLDGPDNLCVSPSGLYLVICEDGDDDQYVRILSREGSQIFDFAKNIVPGNEDNEFAGACFSPKGDTLFVNIQTPGLTFAIWSILDRSFG